MALATRADTAWMAGLTAPTRLDAHDIIVLAGELPPNLHSMVVCYAPSADPLLALSRLTALRLTQCMPPPAELRKLSALTGLQHLAGAAVLGERDQ